MEGVFLDFNRRVFEINLFFDHLSNLELEESVLYFPKRTKRKTKAHPKDLIKILKANSILLLYNLVESSVRQSLMEVYDQISSQNFRYDEVIDEIKKIWIEVEHKKFVNTETNEIFNAINAIKDDVIQMKFESKRISGNIDARKIRQFAIEHGFSYQSDKRAKDGVMLYVVKNQRNKLAHGDSSFAELGRNYTVQQLIATKNEVVLYLRSILRNIKIYLDKTMYAV